MRNNHSKWLYFLTKDLKCFLLTAVTAEMHAERLVKGRGHTCRSFVDRKTEETVQFYTIIVKGKGKAHVS